MSRLYSINSQRMILMRLDELSSEPDLNDILLGLLVVVTLFGIIMIAGLVFRI